VPRYYRKFADSSGRIGPWPTGSTVTILGRFLDDRLREHAGCEESAPVPDPEATPASSAT
jgi:hypothetical protein